MNWLKQLFSSSIGRKFAMALSGLFLMVFLAQHFAINFTSTFSPDLFNELSHFMGTNPLVQFAGQPVLMFGVLFHLVLGIVLELKNRAARGNTKYYSYNGGANASWFSRNMIYSGMFILLFLGFHLYDFWIPEMTYKYIDFKPEDPSRYYPEVVHMFENPIRVGIYCLAFVFLMLHLLHGFQSAFVSIGARHPKYLPAIQTIGKAYAILIPAGFVYIAIYHFLAH